MYNSDVLLPLVLLSIFIGIFVLFGVLLVKAIRKKAISGYKDKLIIMLLFILTGIIGSIIFLAYRLKTKKNKIRRK